MSEKDNGGPAFPLNRDMSINHIGGRDVSSGMSLRDYIAIKAMAALLSDPNELPDEGTDESIDTFYHETASASYEIADAMLKERNK